VAANSAAPDWLLTTDSDLRVTNFSSWSSLYNFGMDCIETSPWLLHYAFTRLGNMFTVQSPSNGSIFFHRSSFHLWCQSTSTNNSWNIYWVSQRNSLPADFTSTPSSPSHFQSYFNWDPLHWNVAFWWLAHKHCYLKATLSILCPKIGSRNSSFSWFSSTTWTHLLNSALKEVGKYFSSAPFLHHHLRTSYYSTITYLVKAA
jgi:hypothetical protein